MSKTRWADYKNWKYHAQDDIETTVWCIIGSILAIVLCPIWVPVLIFIWICDGLFFLFYLLLDKIFNVDKWKDLTVQ